MSTSNPYAVLAQYQAQIEGFGINGAIPTTHNNPCDIEDKHGNIMSFGSIAEGYAACSSKMQFDLSGNSHIYSPSQTVSQFESTWSGGDPNAGNTLAHLLGVSADTPMQSVIDNTDGTQTVNTPDGSYTVDRKNAPSTSGIGNAISAMLPDTVSSFFAAHLSDVVAILAGLVLLAGAVFGFRAITTTVIETAKGAAEIAA